LENTYDVLQWLAWHSGLYASLKIDGCLSGVSSNLIKGSHCRLEQEILIAQYWFIPGTDSSVVSKSNELV